MKRILVVHYSQTGQLARALDAVLAPLRAAGHTLIEVVLEPVEPFPFPWPFLQFLDAFPESVMLQPRPIKPLPDWGEEPFDLVILGYQVWYLSPSQPMTAFLQSPQAARWLRGAPVMTLVACRNMWLMAQEKMKKLIADAGGRHCDHVALTDPPEHVLSSFITTPRWLLRGKKGAFWGLPQAGVADGDIHAARRFGVALADALARNAEASGQPMLRGLQAAPVQTGLILSEHAGHRAFTAWSRIIRAFGMPGKPLRRMALLVFVAYLVLMILAVVPLSQLLQRFCRPLLRARLADLQAKYEAPSGAENYNMKNGDKS